MKFFYHSAFKNHETGGMCPENFERIERALDYLRDNHEEVEPPDGEEFISSVHSEDYIQSIEEASHSGGISQPVPEAYVSKGTYESACYAIGASVESVELAMDEEPSFALVRPPGHHAPFGGFCIFNNIAIAAKKLLDEDESVLILDWDAHHGNGTQDFLRGRENSVYFSIHQGSFYPGTGIQSVDNCYNYPLSSGSGDSKLLKVIEEDLEPLLDEFDPDVVGVSAGFDSMEGDSLTGLRLTEKSYRRACKAIEDYNPFFILEGGYESENVLNGVKAVTEFFE